MIFVKINYLQREDKKLLKNKLQNIEKTLGRNRSQEKRWGERTIDIDIIFYGNEKIETEILSIPLSSPFCV